MQIIDAKKENSRDLAYLINLAGEGIPEYLWKGMVAGSESALDVGAKRAARDEGNFSYKNARICNENNILMAMILAYRQEDPYEIGGLSEYPGVVRPLIELESKVPGSWYINAISTYEEHRGKGVARALILDSEEYAKTCGCTLMSLIVTSENIRAKGLYEYLGFKVIDSQPVVPYPGGCHGGSWLLMTKDLETV